MTFKIEFSTNRVQNFTTPHQKINPIIYSHERCAAVTVPQVDLYLRMIQQKLQHAQVVVVVVVAAMADIAALTDDAHTAVAHAAAAPSASIAIDLVAVAVAAGHQRG